MWYFCCCCFFAALRRFSVGMGYSLFVGLSATLAPRLDSCSHRFPSFFLFFLSSFGFFLFFFLLFSVSFLGFLCYTCMFCSAHIDQQAKKRFIECFLFILAAANFWLDSRTLVSLVWIWHHLGCCLWYQLPFFFTGVFVCWFFWTFCYLLSLDENWTTHPISHFLVCESLMHVYVLCASDYKEFLLNEEGCFLCMCMCMC